MKSRFNLYWVETDDHDEDWFIIARTERQAACWHERAEGYDPGDAFATLVMCVPASLGAELGWPTTELLLACGAKFVRDDHPPVVELAGRRYCGGLLDSEIYRLTDDQAEADGLGRPNNTEPSDTN